MPRYGTIDEDYVTRLSTWPVAGDGDIYMLNLMAYRDEADYGPDGERGISGREADDRYAPLDVLAELGANVCFFADVVAASEPWDRIAVVRYPTRRSFIEMQSRPDFQEKHAHKDAGMDHTTIVATLPTDGFPEGGDLVLLEVWDGPTPASVVDGGSEFLVEGTIIGDGRSWRGARYTRVDDVPDLSAGSDKHQLVVVRPLVSQWR